ncbi:MAG TPA: monovalent cation:proton antiporter-2 (CPA2) family protein [Polyangiales bacterium]
MADPHGNDLVSVVALLGAGVLAVPLFKRLGLGSVLGYLAAGLVIGPFGLGWFSDAGSILHVAELGVVMFLFLVGLEMQPSRLWSLRREIFGLGALQVASASLLITGAGLVYGLPPPTAFVAAMGFVLSSTAIVIQIMEERGDGAAPRGQRLISILLFEDLSIVPLLAFIALYAPVPEGAVVSSRWVSVGLGLGAVLSVIAAGRWLLSPLFQVLAAARAREVMTAAALLVVLGAALVMQLGGLSMAMGAFLAGVLLSESSFRHQLEADIEPFRGILLGLFFLGVGMSLDLSVFRQDWPLIVGGVALLRALKTGSTYLVARLTRAGHVEALYRSTLLAQGGEFAFVLYGAAHTARLLDARQLAVLGAIVILSMALTPLGVFALRWRLPKTEQSLEGIEAAEGLSSSVLIIGFGRFGQVVSQALLARGVDVSIIDTDTEMIRSAADFGFKIYYGDGTRLDVLRASGAEKAAAIAVCVDQRAAADKIVELLKAEFPQARVLVRAFDREHAVRLLELGADYQLRETFESALVFGRTTLEQLGFSDEEAAATYADVRRRDAQRFDLDLAGGVMAGSKMLIGNAAPKPAPFVTPQRKAVALSPETAAVTAAIDS